MTTAPPIDDRSASQIAARVNELLETYAPADRNAPRTALSGSIDPSLQAALVGIFARFTELVIERLNRVPEKNFLAFLDLLGASRLPPRPARVPLTFTAAAGTMVPAVIPLGTQVAAPPGSGEEGPVVFETERELVITPAALAAVFVRDPKADAWGDIAARMVDETSQGALLFHGDQRVEHILYVGFAELLALPAIVTLTLMFELQADLADPRAVDWEAWDGARWARVAAATDGTDGLRVTGAVVFDALPSFQSRNLAGVESRWLRCRLLTPIDRSSKGRAGMVRATELPVVRAVSADVHGSSGVVHPAGGFSNALPLDLTKAFRPFGEQPRIGDAFYLRGGEALSVPGATVKLAIVVANPALPPDGAVSPEPPSGTDPRPAYASDDLTLSWEAWNGILWECCGISKKDSTEGRPGFVDDTSRFTRSGKIELPLPSSLTETTVQGVRGFWIRVRILSGNYGRPAWYVKENESYRVDPGTLGPPIVGGIEFSYEFDRKGVAPDAAFACNDFVERPVWRDGPRSPFSPFEATADTCPTAYLGFTLPRGSTTFPNRPVSLFSRAADVRYGDVTVAIPSSSGAPETSADPPRLSWEYWNGRSWAALLVQDDTNGFARTGMLRFLPPQDFTPREDFGIAPRHWVRVRWDSGDYDRDPRLVRLLLNTTVASQTVSVRNEGLGSSDGTKGQRKRATRAPMLAGQRLEVREPELPAAAERAAIEDAEGANAITTTPASAGRQREIWVRWHEMRDFHASGPRDRHYVVDHLKGEVSFGDGRNGLIPPIGAGNLRLAFYQSGGGARGNRAAGTIVQLKTTLPYVDKVSNPEPALGGADAESLESLVSRAPREVRHGGRAITLEDYEDLAIEASPEVARAKCVPLADLGFDPVAKVPAIPGAVSVIVVPRSTDPKPVPSIELLRAVEDFLDAVHPPTVRLSVVGPVYVRVDVTAEVAASSLDAATAVVAAVQETLDGFLHPLTGGLDGSGWDFGRRPHKSDLFALIERVPGVDYVKALEVREIDEPAGAAATARFLVHSGTHTIGVVVEES